jgi:aryl-alcohol dehydrogenase-like predicted oxidoreductase
MRTHPVDFVQLNYSINERSAESGLLQTAAGIGVAVLINEPLDKGRLFTMVQGVKLPPWALDYDIRTWTDFFLKYILADEAVTAVIPSTSSVAHLNDNMNAGCGKLPDQAGRKKMVEYMRAL